MNDITTKAVTGFERYAFADSITVTGDFKSLSTVIYETIYIDSSEWPEYEVYKKENGIYINVDKSEPPSEETVYYRISDRNTIVRNCNFNFKSDNITIENIDSMFEGCVNAIFSSSLNISNETGIISASRTFRNCTSAKLPVVDILDSDIVRCDRMFENCYSAELCGVQIPRNAEMFEGMFRNSKSAFFNEIEMIPQGNGDYHELFSGCENGVFNNLHFSDSEINLDCGYMFYYCYRMDCENLCFEKISKYITDAGYMFYSAGSNGSGTFDDGIYDFSSLTGCDFAFSNSNFSFKNSYFRFSGRNDTNGNSSTSTISSISRMFSGCTYCDDMSPVVIIGNLQGEEFDISSIESKLDKRLYGHYGNSLKDCIIDFSSLYEGSSFRTLELRGIANNGVLNSNRMECVQNFTSMCKDCGNLENIVGYLPSCASTYKNMFCGCKSLSVDISKLFKTQPYGWGSVSNLRDSFNEEYAFDSYSMTSINGMFKDCGNIYSRNDNFDIVGLFKTVERNLKNNGYETEEYLFESIKNSFPPIRISTKNPIPELKNVRYVIDGISEDTGTVRYNSFTDDKSETEGNDYSDVSYGVHSDYAKSAFGRGFYRYGGMFIGDETKCFFIIYRPEIDNATGDIVDFTSDYIGQNVNLKPHGWGEIFNTDSSKGYWSEFKYDKLYPGIVCNYDGTFIKYAYIGSYTRIYHERRGNSDTGIYEYVTNYNMPVTYFDGCEDNIIPL